MDQLQGVVQDYDWGDPVAIARILGHEPPGHPEAEYWLGAHPKAPSRLVALDRTLDSVVADDPGAAVGPAVAERFDRLPYLLKILAADRPLSIQAHPSLVQAKAGFAREEAAGVDRMAPDRNYRDDNHKPELICAITDFEAKCGFRPVAETRRLVALLDGDDCEPLHAALAPEGSDAEVLAAAVSALLRLAPNEAAALSGGVARAAAEAFERLGPGHEFGTELEWTGRIHEAFPGDIGVVVGLLLNHVTLAPGQAVFLQAGNLHAYLKGVGVELMANSDNVLRGGLTSKHIDVDELIDVVRYEPTSPPIQSSTSPIHGFDIPVPEFGLFRLDSSGGSFSPVPCVPEGPEIVLVTAGSVELSVDGDDEASLRLDAGGAAFVPFADGPYTITDLDPGKTVAWRATVGADGRA